MQIIVVNKKKLVDAQSCILNFQVNTYMVYILLQENQPCVAQMFQYSPKGTTPNFEAHCV